MTFNYDLILEQALDAVGIPYRRFPYRMEEVFDGVYGSGIPDVDGTEVVVLKLHGSLDWIDRTRFEADLKYLKAMGGPAAELGYRRRDPIFGNDPLFDSRPLVEGPRFDDDPLERVAVLTDPSDYFADSSVWSQHAPLILAPSQAKQLYGAPLRDLWATLPLSGLAWTKDSLSIIGYSLPPADPYAKQALYDVARSYVHGRNDPEWRLGPMSRIVVVDKKSPETAVDFRNRYRFLPAQHTDFWLEGFSMESFGLLFQEPDVHCKPSRSCGEPEAADARRC